MWRNDLGCPNASDSFFVKSFSFPFSYHQMVKKQRDLWLMEEFSVYFTVMKDFFMIFLGFTIGNICRISIDYKNDIKEKNSKREHKLCEYEWATVEIIKIFFRLNDRPINQSECISFWHVTNRQLEFLIEQNFWFFLTRIFDTFLDFWKVLILQNWYFQTDGQEYK